MAPGCSVWLWQNYFIIWIVQQMQWEMQNQKSAECISFLWFLYFTWKILGFRKPKCFLSSGPYKASPSEPGISPYLEALPPASLFVSCHTNLSVSLFLKVVRACVILNCLSPLAKRSKLPTLLRLPLLLCIPSLSFYPSALLEFRDEKKMEILFKW